MQSDSSQDPHLPSATMEEELAASTLSKLSRSHPDHAPISVTQSSPAGPSHIGGVNSMQAVIDDLARLAKTVSQDRAVHVDSKDVLLRAHVVGAGFIDTSPADESDLDEEEQMAVEPSLFVGDANRGNVTMNGDSEYIDQGDEEDEEAEEDPALAAAEDQAIRWLNGLEGHIKSLHQTTAAGQPTSCPGLAIEAKAYQYSALAKIEHSRDSNLKAIMIGDPPGLGKTLPAMMSIVKAISTAKRFSVVVVPSSCADQWRAEFSRFFVPDTVQVLALRDPHTSPLEMMRYDVILVSYAFIMSQYRKLCRYLEEVENSKKYGFNQKLERPSLSIFSEIFYAQEGVKCPYLVLDEVTAVKNSTSITFAAIEKLRSLADTVIMLTGSPIDNTWMDVYAFLQFLLDHDIRSRRLMVLLFASRTQKGKLQAPKANKMRRILQLLNSFVVRRPEDTIEIPSLHEHKVKFSLDAEAAMESDRQFGKFMTIINMKSKKDGVQLEGGAQPWKRLTWAQQYAMHPALALIMHLARYPGETDNDLASADILHEAKDIREWTEWRENLEKEEKWKSARIQALIDIFNVRRDIDPKCATLIFDESVYYLDIVDTAFKNMYDPIVCFRFDGRTPPEKRNSILQHFEQAASPKVLLISRATGGVGLNITTANVVILCGPWWKSEWEKQAIKRAHRPGQTREVVAIRMQANNCLVEDYKAKIRDRKHKDNSKIIAHITRKDGVVPKVWHDLEE